MRILLTFEYPFSARGYGGGNQITRGLARALVRLGHEVHVVCGGTDELGVTPEDAPVKYHFCSRYRARTAAFDTARLAVSVARELRPQLLISTTSEAGPLVPMARALGMFTVVYVATPRLPRFRHVTRSFVADVRYQWGPFLQFLGALAANRVVTVSYSLRAEAIDNWGIREGLVDRVGLGIDEALLDVPVSQPPQIDSDGPRFVSVGRIVHWQKPADVMANALASVTRSWSTWTIVGSGADESQLRALVASLGIADRVKFRGTLLRDEIRRELDQCHFVLLPSRYEGMFSTVYEAAARGRIVITNDVNDVRRSFGDVESVIVADRVEPDSYRAAIEHAVDNYPALSREALGVSAKVRATESWDMVASRLLAVPGVSR